MKFNELNLDPLLLKAVENHGFTEPTPIQKRCIPEIKKGFDLVGQSLTGSGKTLAFALPMFEKVSAGAGLQGLVLTPTRELANQLKERFVAFSAFTKIFTTSVYGGVGMQPQVDALKKADIVVGTPGRLLDHMWRGTINLNKITILVLDEADKMFEMGFAEDVEKIIRALPSEHQTLLFSATIPSAIHKLINVYLKNPVWIKEEVLVDKSLLRQIYYDVRQDEKFSLLVHLLKHKTPGLAIVFCRTRREVDIIEKNLKNNGIKAMAVHGGLSQMKRDQAITSLRSEDIQVLVATDVAARGLDINSISHIYNYDSAKSPTEYIHRIGRTARAGNAGEAATILARQDYENFQNVISDRTLSINKEDTPNFLRIELRRNSFGRGPPRSGGFNKGRRHHNLFK